MQNFSTTKNLVIAVRPFNQSGEPVPDDSAQNDRKWQPMKTKSIQGEFEMIAGQWKMKRRNFQYLDQITIWLVGESENKIQTISEDDKQWRNNNKG